MTQWELYFFDDDSELDELDERAPEEGDTVQRKRKRTDASESPDNAKGTRQTL
jgi:hypothetical protein